MSLVVTKHEHVVNHISQPWQKHLTIIELELGDWGWDSCHCSYCLSAIVSLYKQRVANEGISERADIQWKMGLVNVVDMAPSRPACLPDYKCIHPRTFPRLGMTRRRCDPYSILQSPCLCHFAFPISSSSACSLASSPRSNHGHNTDYLTWLHNSVANPVACQQEQV